jgi:2-methylisocitrate lyase-like PEP mutase family enzyme
MHASDLVRRRAVFRRLHEAGCFLIPNPWDAGSAHVLEGLGFQALATTSSGFAWSRARPDHGADVEVVLAHCREIVAATDLPVSADFENGYARDLDGLKDNVRRCVETGVAGLSIEDATGADVMLVARAECFLVGHPDPLNESVKRLRAYAAAGADCLFAPGVREPEQIRAIVAAVAPKPVNVLVGYPATLALADFAQLGVRRVSVGGALAGAAWGAFLRAARGLADGRFDGFAQNASHGEVDGLFESR